MNNNTYSEELHNAMKKSLPKAEKLFNDSAMSQFSNTPINDLRKYNMTFGSLIRLKLLRKSVSYRLFLKNGFTDRDDMSMEILYALHSMHTQGRGK